MRTISASYFETCFTEILKRTELEILRVQGFEQAPVVLISEDQYNVLLNTILRVIISFRLT